MEAHMKVLVVDDSAINRRFIERALALDGYLCESVGDGESALKILDNNSDIGAVICDLIMPGLDGTDTYWKHLERMQRAEREPVPFILLTGAGDIGGMKEAKGLGFVDILSKPPDYDRLNQVLEDINKNQAKPKKTTADSGRENYAKIVEDLTTSILNADDREGAHYFIKVFNRAAYRLTKLI